MSTENIDIVIREEGATKAAANIKEVGTAAKGTSADLSVLDGAITQLKGLLTSLGIAFGIREIYQTGLAYRDLSDALVDLKKELLAVNQAQITFIRGGNALKSQITIPKAGAEGGLATAAGAGGANPNPAFATDVKNQAADLADAIAALKSPSEELNAEWEKFQKTITTSLRDGTTGSKALVDALKPLGTAIEGVKGNTEDLSEKFDAVEETIKNAVNAGTTGLSALGNTSVVVSGQSAALTAALRDQAAAQQKVLDFSKDQATAYTNVINFSGKSVAALQEEGRALAAKQAAEAALRVEQLKRLDIEKLLFDFSQNTATSIKANIPAYIALAKSAKDLSVSQETLLFTLSRIDDEDKKEKFAGFIKGVKDGILSGEQLRTLMADFPEVASQVAKGLGLTAEQMAQLAVRQVSNANGMRVLTNNTRTFHEGVSVLNQRLGQHGPALDRAGGAAGRLGQQYRGLANPQIKTEFTQQALSLERLFEGLTNATTKVAEADATVENSLQRLANAAFIVVGAFGKAINENESLANAIGFVATNLKVLLEILGTVGAVYATLKVAAFTAALIEAVSAIGFVTSAMVVFRTVTAETNVVFGLLAGATALISGGFRALFATIAANPFTSLAVVLTTVISLTLAFGQQLQLTADGSITAYGVLVGTFNVLLSSIQTVWAWVNNLQVAFSLTETQANLVKVALASIGVILVVTLFPALTALVVVLGSLLLAFLAIGSVTALLAGRLDEFNASVLQMADNVKTKLTTAWTDASKAAVDLGDKTTKTNKDGVETTNEFTKAVDGLDKSLNNTATNTLPRLTQATRQAADATAGLRNAMGQTVQATSDWAARSGEYFNQTQNGLTKAAGAYDSFATSATGSLDRVASAQNKLNDWSPAGGTRGGGGGGGGGGGAFSFNMDDPSVFYKDDKINQLWFALKTYFPNGPDDPKANALVAQIPKEWAAYFKELLPDRFVPYFSKFAGGGSFMVGGQTGTDKNIVQFLASRDEQVIVRTPAQQRAAASGGGANISGGRPITVNMQVVTRDADSFRRNEKQIMTGLKGRIASVEQYLRF